MKAGKGAGMSAETRGRLGLALGRGTPGLRTLTVVAAAVSGLSGRRALPPLIVGSSVFLQLHLVLGLLLGPLADRAFDQAKGPALAAGAVLVGAGLVFWRIRRRQRAAAPAVWMEAACPACVGLRRPEPAVRPGAGPVRAGRPGAGRPACLRGGQVKMIWPPAARA
jgi:hypothetical protein